ncbi:MAG: hypothetical protein M1504_00075 [Candidatus Marsarchaeota archaeon]|nr:hypothetical protein [Candidatus Marsarchaeota archaeon]
MVGNLRNRVAGQARIEGNGVSVNAVFRGKSMHYVVIDSVSSAREMKPFKQIVVENGKVWYGATFFTTGKEIPLDFSTREDMDVAMLKRDYLAAYLMALNVIGFDLEKMRRSEYDARKLSEMEGRLTVLNNMKNSLVDGIVMEPPTEELKEVREGMEALAL